jgi:hypothetical protein
MYEDIKITTFQVLIDPILSFFIPLTSCKSFSCRKRQRILEKSQEKFNDELDIITLLNKIRDSYDVVQNIAGRE